MSSPMRPAPAAIRLVSPLGVEFVAVVFEQRLAEPVDATKRRTEVMRDRVAECLELLVRDPEGGFDPFSLGYVTDRTRHERALLRVERALPNFDRKLRAVLPPPEEFRVGARRTELRRAEGDLASPLRFVAGTVSGDENVGVAAEEIVARISEEALGLGVYEDDAPGG